MQIIDYITQIDAMPAIGNHIGNQKTVIKKAARCLREEVIRHRATQDIDEADLKCSDVQSQQ